MTADLSDVRVVICGMGLMGGSLGLALRGQVDQVTGIEIDPAAAREAVRRGAASEVSQPDEAQAAVRRCDVLVLAQPAGQMAPVMRQLAPGLPAGCIVTDLAGAKAAVIEQLAGLVPPEVTYVPGHPLAGSEREGIAAAREDLYREAVWMLTEKPPRLLAQMIEAAGAEVRLVDAHRHDRMMARTSHLPHLMAHVTAAVGMKQAESEDGCIDTFCGGGFADTTRVAAGSPSASADMCLYNSCQLVPAVREASVLLDQLTDMLQRGDRDELQRRLGEVALWLRERKGKATCK